MRKLEGYFGSTQKSVERLVDVGETGDFDVAVELAKFLLEEGLANEVVDGSAVGVVDGAVAGDNKLRASLFGEFGAEMVVGIENVGDAFAGIEAGDLDEVGSASVQRGLVGLEEVMIEELEVVVDLVFGEIFVEAVQGIGGGGHGGGDVFGDIVGNELRDGVGNEGVCMLGKPPNKFPGSVLRSSWLVG